MRRFLYTPIHTIPIDSIKYIYKGNNKIEISHENGTIYFVKEDQYNDGKFLTKIYEDIQRQLMGNS